MEVQFDASGADARRGDDTVEEAADDFAGFAGGGVFAADGFGQVAEPIAVHVGDAGMERDDGFGLDFGEFSGEAVAIGGALAHARLEFREFGATLGDRVDQTVELGLGACEPSLDRGATGQTLAAPLVHRTVKLADEFRDDIWGEHLVA